MNTISSEFSNTNIYQFGGQKESEHCSPVLLNAWTQLVELFGKIRRSGLVGEGVSLGGGFGLS